MTDQVQIAQEPLTEREREIVALIAQGLSNQQIADQLYLTLDTVKWYNKQIFQKLGVHNRTQVLLSARQPRVLGEPAATVMHNLPEQGTPFIGRQPELAALQTRLADPRCRLLTLLGPGGIGKSRLAIEAAHHALASGSPLAADGVYLVPFAPVASAAFVVQALADGVGLVLTNQRRAMDQLIHYLRERRLLLLLDNFEHLLAARDLLGELLARWKWAKLLVTSRERLHLQEEWLFDVQGLRYPAAERAGQPEADPAAYEAGQLFLATAQRAKADFVPDEQDQEQIVHICRLVGGMPLGIELAASWLRLLPCAEIARAIAQDLALLTSAWRDVPARHRSIQAVLDHSWHLISGDEQELFRRLTIFSGPFRREAAAAVAESSLPLLLALVDKSFLRRTDNDRFGIHELVKQYGSEKLQADLETLKATQLRHCRYHTALLTERMAAPEAGPNLAEIESVFADLQAAWRYAVEEGQVAQIRQLAEGFLRYYRLHRWYRAGSGALAIYQQALACFDPHTDHAEQRAALACLHESIGELHALATAHAEALVAFEHALAITDEHDYLRRGRLYGRVADVWVDMHQHERGHEHYTLAESVLAQAPQRVAAWWYEWLDIATKLMNLYYVQNRPEEMAALEHQIQPLIDQHGSVTQRVFYLQLLGLMALRRARYFHSNEAITYTGESLPLSLASGNLGDIALAHFNHGFSHLWSDHLDEAESYIQRARELAAQNGDLTLLARTVTYLAVVYRKRSDNERLRLIAAQNLRSAEEATMPQYTGMAHGQYAWLAWQVGDLVETKRQADAAIAAWGGLGQGQSVVVYRWLALFPLLAVCLQEGDVAASVRRAQELIAPSQMRLPDELTTLLEQAVAAGENGSLDVADNLLRQALQLAQALHYL